MTRTASRLATFWNARRTRVAAWTVLLVGLIAHVLPISPVFPAAGLDPDWTVATNQAVAQGLVFGRDFIFTSGPFSAVYSHAYHPATFVRVFAVCALLLLCLGLELVFLLRSVRTTRLAAVAAALALLPMYMDVLLLAIPLLAVLTSVRIITTRERGDHRGRQSVLLTIAAYAPLGLTPLAKGSSLALCAIAVVIGVGILLVERKFLAAVSAAAAATASMLALWLLAGQPLAGLPEYFASMSEITRGYTAAMAFTYAGKPLEAVYALLEYTAVVGAALGVLWLVVGCASRHRLTRLGLGLMYAAFLFLAYKAGFVRQDAHVMIGAGAVLLGALMLPPTTRSDRLQLVLAIALVGVLLPMVRETTIGSVDKLYGSSVSGIVRSLRDVSWRKREYRSTMTQLAASSGLPRLSGTSDIYSWGQCALIASGNTWSPRPVFQSYSAYTPRLLEANLRHLQGAKAPDHIFFTAGSFDGQYPALEDGASWPELLTLYNAAVLRGDRLQLERRSAPSASRLVEIGSSKTHSLGEWVDLPASPPIVFALFDVEPTVLGRLRDLLYKPAELRITVKLADGTTADYEFVSGKARTGFVLSPLVENTADFQRLFAADRPVGSKRVAAIRLYQAPSSLRLLRWGWGWRRKYSLQFETLR